MALEDDFHEAMVESYRRTGRETGYWANYFNRDVKAHGGLAIAKKLLRMESHATPGKGLQALIDHGRAENSVEFLVLLPNFKSLFTDEERQEAKSRLDAIPAHGFRHRVVSANVQIEDLDVGLTYQEGAALTVVVNAYERNVAARDACLKHHGHHCAACGMTFLGVYGAIGDGFIHVHHVKPLAAIRKEYELDPVKDLIPVCPNCHAMLHTHIPPLSVEELRVIISNRPLQKEKSVAGLTV